MDSRPKLSPEELKKDKELKEDKKLVSEALNKVLNQIFELLSPEDKKDHKAGDALSFRLPTGEHKKTYTTHDDIAQDKDYPDNAVRSLYEMFRLIKESKILTNEKWNDYGDFTKAWNLPSSAPTIRTYAHDLDPIFYLTADKHEFFKDTNGQWLQDGINEGYKEIAIDAKRVVLEKNGAQITINVDHSWLPHIVDPKTFKLACIVRHFFEDVRHIPWLPERAQIDLKEQIVAIRAIRYAAKIRVPEILSILSSIEAKLPKINIQEDNTALFQEYNAIKNEFRNFSSLFGHYSTYTYNRIFAEVSDLIKKIQELYNNKIATPLIDKVKAQCEEVNDKLKAEVKEVPKKQGNVIKHYLQINKYLKNLHGILASINSSAKRIFVFAKITKDSEILDLDIENGLSAFVYNTYAKPLENEIDKIIEKDLVKELIDDFKKDNLDPLIKQWQDELQKLKQSVETEQDVDNLKRYQKTIESRQNEIKNTLTSLLPEDKDHSDASSQETAMAKEYSDARAKLLESLTIIFDSQQAAITKEYADLTKSIDARIVLLDSANYEKSIRDLEGLLELYSLKMEEIESAETEYKTTLDSLDMKTDSKLIEHSANLKNAEAKNGEITKKIDSLEEIQKLIKDKNFSKVYEFYINGTYAHLIGDEYKELFTIITNNALAQRSIILHPLRYSKVKNNDDQTCLTIIAKLIEQLQSQISDLVPLERATAERIAHLESEAKKAERKFSDISNPIYQLLDTHFEKLTMIDQPEPDLKDYTDGNLYQRRLQKIIYNLVYRQIHMLHDDLNLYDEKIKAVEDFNSTLFLSDAVEGSYESCSAEIKSINEQWSQLKGQMCDAKTRLSDRFDLVQIETLMKELKMPDSYLENMYNQDQSKYQALDRRFSQSRFNNELTEVTDKYNKVLAELKEIEDLLNNRPNYASLIEQSKILDPNFTEDEFKFFLEIGNRLAILKNQIPKSNRLQSYFNKMIAEHSKKNQAWIQCAANPFFRRTIELTARIDNSDKQLLNIIFVIKTSAKISFDGATLTDCKFTGYMGAINFQKTTLINCHFSSYKDMNFTDVILDWEKESAQILADNLTQRNFENNYNINLINLVHLKNPACINSATIIDLLNKLSTRNNILFDERKSQSLFILKTMINKIDSLEDLAKLSDAKLRHFLKSILKNTGFFGFFKKNKGYEEIMQLIQERVKKIIASPKKAIPLTFTTTTQINSVMNRNKHFFESSYHIEEQVSFRSGFVTIDVQLEQLKHKANFYMEEYQLISRKNIFTSQKQRGFHYRASLLADIITLLNKEDLTTAQIEQMKSTFCDSTAMKLGDDISRMSWKTTDSNEKYTVEYKTTTIMKNIFDYFIAYREQESGREREKLNCEMNKLLEIYPNLPNLNILNVSNGNTLG